MLEIVLDASAVLALLNTEEGADVVAASLPGAVISAINLSEVIAKLSGEGMPEGTIRQALEPLGLEVMPFDEAQAYHAGLLRTATQSKGISLGDRACLSLGKTLGAIILTADKMWTGLNVGVNIKVIR